MFHQLSAKNKTMFFVSSVLVLFSLLMFMFIYMEQKKRVDDLQTSYYTHFRQSYDKIISKHKEFYENRIKANIGSIGVKKALLNKDREKLYELSKGRWETLSNENRFLEVMHFHLYDGSSFLRMHEPQRYGDFIAKRRPMVAQVHAKKEPVFGYEAGIYSFSYRVLHPIFEEGNYLGALEFGSRPEHILAEMKFFYDLKGAVFVKKNPITIKNNRAILDLDGYSLVYENLNNEKVLRYITKKYNFEDNKNIEVDGRVYVLYSIDLLDFKNYSTGKVVFLNDITGMQKEFYQTIEKLFIFLFLLLLALLFVVNFGFKKIITILDTTNEKLKQNQQKVHNYLELIDKNIITSNTDLDGNITYASEALCSISGYTKEELIGKNYNIFKHEDMDNGIYENLWRVLKSEGFFKGDIKNRKKDGGYFWVECSIYTLYDENQNRIGYTSVKRDITDRKRVEEISITDALTGIYNRRHFNEVCPKVVLEAKRKNELVSFLIMDIDYFKEYNDCYGHQAGDKALENVAKSMKESLKRASDYCFRLGGEEFGVILKPEDKQSALKVANKIKKSIGDLKIVHEKNSATKHLSVSIGLVTKFACDIADCESIYKEADELLYKSKSDGRNTISTNK